MVKSIYCNILLIWTLTFSHRSLPGRYFVHVIIFIISCLGLGGYNASIVPRLHSYLVLICCIKVGRFCKEQSNKLVKMTQMIFLFYVDQLLIIYLSHCLLQPCALIKPGITKLLIWFL